MIGGLHQFAQQVCGTEMYNSRGINPESRPQLVPSPSHGACDLDSPLSLEHCFMSDLGAWWRDEEVPIRGSTTPKFSSQQILYMYNSLDSKLLSYRNLSVVSDGLSGSSSTKSDTTATSNQWAVNVSIPSPATSFNSISAESPTLYETSLPLSKPTKNTSGKVNNPQFMPISPDQIKRELPDDYCSSGSSPYEALQNPGKTEDELTNSCQLSQENFQQVQYLAMEQVSRDIDLACQVLGISHDPINWSADDVQAWFVWTLKQYSLPSMLLDFSMNGQQLCSITEDEFRHRAPQGGETLYAQLDIWKTTANLRKNSQNLSLSPFRVEDSFLDINGLLNQCSASSISTPSIHTKPVAEKISNRPIPVPSRSGSKRCRTNTVASSVVMETEGLPTLASRDCNKGDLESEDETSEDSCDTDVCGGSAIRPGSHSHIHLWQFLKELLSQPQMYGSCIRWLDRPKSIFKIEDSVRVARLWGKRKNRPAMNYDKLSRSIRQYYKKGIMKKTERSQRLVYQFCHPYGL
ncbi:DNA-binding protein D-ETS-4-like [Tachypleus tridentatus]|uniref:DNA-binding protein D-ETS-4-like n=1 Tax=Tachypleus tridentatus TaxID=6853 RepID=UPI003FD2B22F